MKNMKLIYIILLGLILNTLIEGSPQSTGRIWNVDIAGQGTYASIAVNSDFSVSFSYRVWNGWEGGSGCIVYLPIGLGFARDSLMTPYNSAEACGVPGFYPGNTGSATLQLRAPSAAGTYGIFFNFYEVTNAAYACQVFRAEYHSVQGHYPVYGIIDVYTGVEENTCNSASPLDLHIIPNPSSNDIKIEFFLGQNEQVRIRIFDIAGKLVRSLSDRLLQSGRHQIIWNVRDSNNNAVPAGIYICDVATADKKSSKQVILVK